MSRKKVIECSACAGGKPSYVQNLRERRSAKRVNNSFLIVFSITFGLFLFNTAMNCLAAFSAPPGPIVIYEAVARLGVSFLGVLFSVDYWLSKKKNLSVGIVYFLSVGSAIVFFMVQLQELALFSRIILVAYLAVLVVTVAYYFNDIRC